MITVDDALARVLALIKPTGFEDVPLTRAANRVLAAPVISARDQPPFAASAMDGYAVRAEDAANGARLKVVAEIPAGGGWDGALDPGEAARIFTGAPAPQGADAILIQENADRVGDAITVREQPAKGAYIRPAGLDFRIGARIDAPRRLSAEDIALCAAMNSPFVTVRRRPRVHLIATGDELVAPGQQPAANQIVSSNNYGLAALAEAAGAEATIQPIARDNAAALREALDRAEGADLIVTLGGASVGDHDLVQQVFGEEGLDLSFYKVAMRPGKPMMAGRVRGAVMLGLPGNPVSSMVLGRLILRPALDAFLGLPAGPPARQIARLGEPTGPNGPREHFMRARLEMTEDGPRVFPFPDQDSSILSVLAAANALAIRPPHAPAASTGDEIEVIPLT